MYDNIPTQTTNSQIEPLPITLRFRLLKDLPMLPAGTEFARKVTVENEVLIPNWFKYIDSELVTLSEMEAQFHTSAVLESLLGNNDWLVELEPIPEPQPLPKPEFARISQITPFVDYPNGENGKPSIQVIFDFDSLEAAQINLDQQIDMLELQKQFVANNPTRTPRSFFDEIITDLKSFNEPKIEEVEPKNNQFEPELLEVVSAPVAIADQPTTNSQQNI